MTLLKAVSSDRVRLLLADEVGLGKTIEAGLILKELKLRGLVCRVLVVAPKGLVTQWVSEMRTHSGEDSRLLLPGDFPAFRRVAAQDNVWKTHDQVVCPLDSVKPIERRRGWSKEQIAEYNRDRYRDLLAAIQRLALCRGDYHGSCRLRRRPSISVSHSGVEIYRISCLQAVRVGTNRKI